MPSIYLFCNIYMCRLLHADLQIDKPIKKTKDYFLSQQFLFIYKTLWLFVSKEFASYNVGWKQIHEIVLTQTMYTLLSTLVAITKIKWRKKKKTFSIFSWSLYLAKPTIFKEFLFLILQPLIHYDRLHKKWKRPNRNPDWHQEEGVHCIVYCCSEWRIRTHLLVVGWGIHLTLLFRVDHWKYL